jgi:hypothetical protein
MERLGSTKTALRNKIETLVGDIARHMLLQNESRFKALWKTQTISVTTNSREYMLNPDFRTVAECYEVDSTGEPEGEVYVISKKEIRRRKIQGLTTGDHYGWVEKKVVNNVPGFYLTLADDPSEAMTLELDYYRIPTTSDVPIIADVDTLKRGVLGQLTTENPSFQIDMAVFESRVPKFKEPVARVQTRNRLYPSNRILNSNARMQKWGGGR